MEHHGDAGGTVRPCKSSKDHLVQIGGQPAPVYWKSVDELLEGPRVTGEFPGGLPSAASYSNPTETTRRDFLALMGFSLAAAGLAGCRAPVQHAIPLLVGSDQIIPGVSNFYATTCRGCAASCSLLVKQRDGRPIKIEGNAESALFGSGTCATGQATVLSLYDDARLTGPLWRRDGSNWEEVDRRVMDALAAAKTTQRSVVLLSGTITSPSTREIIAEWGRQNPRFRHVEYDAVSFSAMRQANKDSFGQAVVPHYLFDKAKVIVGFEADFLGAWLSPVEFARQYASARKLEGKPALHIQFESGLSVTGSNADARVPVSPSQLPAVVVALLARIAHLAGEGPAATGSAPIEAAKLDAIAEELWKHRGESLVVSGVNDVAVQTLVNTINSLLGNIGKTIDLARPSHQRSGDDAAMAQLVEEMSLGDVHTLILYGVNPVYNYADSQKFASSLEKVALSVSLSDRLDETSSMVDAVCPDHHFLEAWGDAQPVEGYYSLAQPLISPLRGSRAAQESLLRWLGQEQPDYHTYLREFWRKNLFAHQGGASNKSGQSNNDQNFDMFWDRTLQQGLLVTSPAGAAVASFHGDYKTAMHNIMARPARPADSYEVSVYESVGLRDGRHANNPWLQELPDPISKVTWGNYAAVAPGLAKKLGLSNGDVVKLKTDKAEIEVPVFTQPGQDGNTISIALGYGRNKGGKVAQNVGANAFALTSVVQGQRSFSAAGLRITRTGAQSSVASSQSHFSLEGRPIVMETTLEELHKEAEKPEEIPTLWADRLQGEHNWGMAIDMNSCTGCSACVVACQAENNVPVVGKDQIERIRIMHWIRIDRYYTGHDEDNPEAFVHQPMMCQHCQNAPCESVCPVVATTTSSEGLNQQVYNRCIGTRYCANNCPYKVRRFNWYNYTENQKFDFNMESPLGRLVLNPDVAVRSRGVMEKCSMCVQRIQLAKNVALQGDRPLADGDIQTACQQSCPTQAIVFGDLKDPNSRVSKLQRSQRHYDVLEDLGTRPNVGYLKKVRNPMERS